MERLGPGPPREPEPERRQAVERQAAEQQAAEQQAAEQRPAGALALALVWARELEPDAAARRWEMWLSTGPEAPAPVWPEQVPER